MRRALNIDLGELGGEPEELYALADVANIACGGHAGDDASMRAAALFAARYRTRLAAHPSYEDRAGFGRVSMSVAPAELRESIRAQCAALARVAAPTRVGLVKPHGALYHDAARSEIVAEALLDGALEALGDVEIVGPPWGELAAAAGRRGLSYLREGFADRAYLPSGRLVPRADAGAMIDEPSEAAAQAVRLVTGGLDTICVHGDGPRAVEVARAVQRALAALPA